MTQLADRVAIVTGASRGIGFAIAQRFVAEGARVCITGRDATALETAAKDLGGPDVAIGVAGKGDDDDHRAQVIDTVVGTFGQVTTLVNNIGINPAYGPLGSLDLGAARKMIDVNVLGTLGWVQEGLRGGLAEGGSIVTISSVSGVRPAPGIAFYGVTKAALIHLTRELAVELAPRIRVNAIAPGYMLSDMTRQFTDANPELARGWIERIPAGRMGEPADLDGLVVLLCSNRSSYIVGQSVVIDGAYTAV